MPSRQIHRVRIVSPDDPAKYIEIAVTDALGLGAPNGQDIFFDCSKPDPLVIDDTGDGSGREAAAPTRKSHMERLTNPDDPSSAMDVEVLDAFGFIGPNGQETFYSIPNTNSYQSDDPSSAAPFTRDGTIKTFTDPTNPANVLQVLTVKELTTGSAGTYAPPATYGEIAFKLDDSSVLDTTRTSLPPKNTDPNPYLKLLPGKTPWLGKNVVVKQGPLWKISDVHWGTGDILVLQWHATYATTTASQIFSATLRLPQIGFVADIAFPFATVVDPPGTLPNALLAGKSMWEYPPVDDDSTSTGGGGTITVVDRGNYYLSTDRGLVTSWIDPLLGELVPFIWDHNGDRSGGALIDADVAGLLGEAVGRICDTTPTPFLASIISSHDETVPATIHYQKAQSAFIFLDLSKIAGLLPSGTSSLQVNIEASGTISATHDDLSWTAQASTWKGTRKTFPVTPSPDYEVRYGFPFDFDPPPFPDGSVALSAGGVESIVHPATAEFVIDLTTFGVTGTRVDH